MLVLTRKSGEKIRISENIIITVLRIQGNSIRLGIEAPRDISIVREELPPRARLADETVTSKKTLGQQGLVKADERARRSGSAVEPGPLAQRVAHRHTQPNSEKFRSRGANLRGCQGPRPKVVTSKVGPVGRTAVGAVLARP